MLISTSDKNHGPAGAVSSAFATLYERRWLIGYLVRRQLSKSYQNSYLGFLWAFLGPRLMVVLYTLVFSEIIGIRFRVVEEDSSLNFGLYLYCGILPFLAFSDALNQSTNVIRTNSALVKRLVFPTEILPLTTAVSALAEKLFGLGVLIIVLLLLEHRLYWTLVLLPLIMVLQLLFMLGLSYVFSVIGTFLPDVRETLRAFVRAMFFVTPILWPEDRAEGYLRLVVDLNPLAYLVGAYRDLVLEGEVPGGMATLWFGLFAGVLCATGFVMFLRVKRRFADLI